MITATSTGPYSGARWNKSAPSPIISVTLNYFNSILPSTPNLLDDHFPSDFLTKIPYVFCISPMYAMYSSHPITLSLVTLTIIDNKCKFWSCSLHNFYVHIFSSALHSQIYLHLVIDTIFIVCILLCIMKGDCQHNSL
jgi:hypothetical protein